jgi:ribosomal protein S18 acetylase RimI-like enzyme
MVVRRATPEDASIYERDIGTDSRSTFRARLVEGTTCYLVIADERAVHATWCTTTGAWTREIGAVLIPPAGDAYVYESYTRPEVRGRGVYPYALGRIAAELSGRAVRCVWVAVEASNTASLRAVAKAGFEPSFVIGYRRRWGRIEVASDEAASPERLHLADRGGWGC